MGDINGGWIVEFWRRFAPRSMRGRELQRRLTGSSIRSRRRLDASMSFAGGIRVNTMGGGDGPTFAMRSMIRQRACTHAATHRSRWQQRRPEPNDPSPIIYHDIRNAVDTPRSTDRG